MFIDEIDQRAEKNRKCFSATGWRVDHATVAINDMLPGLLLEKKWMQPFRGEPVVDDPVTGCIVEIQFISD